MFSITPTSFDAPLPGNARGPPLFALNMSERRVTGSLLGAESTGPSSHHTKSFSSKSALGVYIYTPASHTIGLLQHATTKYKIQMNTSQIHNTFETDADYVINEHAITSTVR